MRVVQFLKKLFGFASSRDFIIGSFVLIVASFFFYVCFVPVQPVKLIFPTFTLDFSIPTLIISYFSLYINVSFLVVLFVGFVHFLSTRIKGTPLPTFTLNPHFPLVSILIPCHNEAPVIGNLLNHLKSQTYKNWEAVVIAHNCTDETAKVVKSFKDDKRIRLFVLNGESGKSVALNFGVEKTKGEYITILDADAGIRPNYLHDVMRYFPECDVVQSIIETSNRNFNLLTKLQDIEIITWSQLYQRGRKVLGLNNLLCGTGQTFKREALEKLLPWSKILTEDYELSMKAKLKGVKIAYLHGVPIYDEKHPFWLRFIKQRARWLKGNMQTLKAYKKKIFKLPTEWYILLSPLTAWLQLYSIALTVYYLCGGRIYAQYPPNWLWLSIFIVQQTMILTSLLLIRGKSCLLYFPLYLLYPYYMLPTLYYTLKIKGWKDTKTPHGFLEVTS